MAKQKRVRKGRRVSYIHKCLKGTITFIQGHPGDKTLGYDYVLSFTVGSKGYLKILSAWCYYGYPLAKGDTITVHRKQGKKSLPTRFKDGGTGGKKK